MSEDTVRRLGKLLTGTEADQLAELYREGLTLTQALQAVSASRRQDVRALLEASAGNIELVWDMDDAFMRQLAALGARMKSLGIIAQEPDYAKLVDRSFVDALRADSANHE